MTSDNALVPYEMFGVFAKIECPEAMNDNGGVSSLRLSTNDYVTQILKRNRIKVLSQAEYISHVMNEHDSIPLLVASVSIKEVDSSYSLALSLQVVARVAVPDSEAPPVQGAVWQTHGHYVVKQVVYSGLTDYLHTHLEKFLADYRKAHVQPLQLVEEGDWAHGGGRSIEALELYDRALAADASCWQAMANKAMVLGTLGRYEEAISLFDRALAINPRAVVVAMKREALLDRMRGDEDGRGDDSRKSPGS